MNRSEQQKQKQQGIFLGDFSYFYLYCCSWLYAILLLLMLLFSPVRHSTFSLAAVAGVAKSFMYTYPKFSIFFNLYLSTMFSLHLFVFWQIQLQIFVFYTTSPLFFHNEIYVHIETMFFFFAVSHFTHVFAEYERASVACAAATAFVDQKTSARLCTHTNFDSSFTITSE